MSLEVSLGTWKLGRDGIGRTIQASLTSLGYTTSYFSAETDVIPESADVVFTWAPWGRLQPITRQLAQISPDRRPAWVHWSTEDPPDLRLPWRLLLTVGQVRAWFDRFNDAEKNEARNLLSLPLARWLNTHLYKFRYVGEYHYAQQHGYLTVLADISKVYADFFNSNGLKSLYAPWGLIHDGQMNITLEDDIDVLWLGTRRTRRRSKLLDQVREGLLRHGVDLYVVDGIEHPQVYGEKRNKLVCRAKIMLNLLPTWYDNALVYRFPVAAANKSMVVSETSLPHNPMLKNKVHFVAVPTDKIVPTILHYLENERGRRQIVEAAYDMITQQLKMDHSVKMIMDSVTQRARSSTRQE